MLLTKVLTTSIPQPSDGPTRPISCNGDLNVIPRMYRGQSHGSNTEILWHYALDLLGCIAVLHPIGCHIEAYRSYIVDFWINAVSVHWDGITYPPGIPTEVKNPDNDGWRISPKQQLEQDLLVGSPDELKIFGLTRDFNGPGLLLVGAPGHYEATNVLWPRDDDTPTYTNGVIWSKCVECCRVFVGQRPGVCTCGGSISEDPVKEAFSIANRFKIDREGENLHAQKPSMQIWPGYLDYGRDHSAMTDETQTLNAEDTEKSDDTTPNKYAASNEECVHWLIKNSFHAHAAAVRVHERWCEEAGLPACDILTLLLGREKDSNQIRIALGPSPRGTDQPIFRGVGNFVKDLFDDGIPSSYTPFDGDAMPVAGVRNKGPLSDMIFHYQRFVKIGRNRTQKQLAAAMPLEINGKPMTGSHISKIAGGKFTNAETMLKIARYLGIPFVDFKCANDAETKPPFANLDEVYQSEEIASIEPLPLKTADPEPTPKPATPKSTPAPATPAVIQAAPAPTNGANAAAMAAMTAVMAIVGFEAIKVPTCKECGAIAAWRSKDGPICNGCVPGAAALLQ